MARTAPDYDVAIIGSGLGGLTAGAILAKAGHRVCVIEKNDHIGGSASTYRRGDLVIETALHETADPNDPADPKHFVLKRLGLFDTLEWVPVGPLYAAEGGLLGDTPFVIGEGFDHARAQASARFGPGSSTLLDRMERIREAMAGMMEARDPPSLVKLVHGLAGMGPVMSDWRRTLSEVFAADLGDDEAAKCAFGANLPYYGDDPARLWWIFYAVAQSSYIAAGGCYVKGGSSVLTQAIADVITDSGGAVLTGRRAVSVMPPGNRMPGWIEHEAADGRERTRTTARAVAANCAPHALAGMLNGDQADRLADIYRDRAVSTSLFTAFFGVRRDAAASLPEHYSTILFPQWMTRFSDYAHAGQLMGAGPGERLPPVAVVNMGAIDSGLGGPDAPILVSVTGTDHASNWQGLDREGARSREQAWTEALAGMLDARWPGFAGAVTDTAFHSAHTLADYLGTPDGAVYGFAMRPPQRPIWFGMGRSPRTPVPGVFLASAFGGGGGYSGAIGTGAMAGDMIANWLKRHRA